MNNLFSMLYSRISLSAILLFVVVSCTDLPLKDQIDPDAEWAVTIEKTSGNREEVIIRNTDVTTPVIKGNTVHYENIGGKDIDLTVNYKASKKYKGALEISSVIANNEKDWMVKVFNAPTIRRFKVTDDHAFIIPAGTGWRLPLSALSSMPEGKKIPKPWTWNKSKKAYVFSETYPSKKITMQWGLLQGKDECVYIGCHDESCSYKTMETWCDPAAKEALIKFVHKMTCFPGEVAEIPPVIIYKYEGDWYEGADIYREWFLENHKVTESPEWMRNNTGWLLAILKQQNDEVIVPYDEIGELLADAADERGLDVIGLFGRGIGGHDRYYPDYSPDPKLGGEKALKEGIAKAKAKGKRVVMYTNGQLLDQDCPWFWPDTGRFISIQRKNGVLEAQTWHKYHDAPARTHGMACHSCRTWKEMMMRLALQANELGADGILYDQLGCTGSRYCYSPDHGHPVPAVVYEEDRIENLAWVREEMAKINPEFVIMVEGLIDSQMGVVDMFHGSSPVGTIPTIGRFLNRFDENKDLQFFYELYRYTFPEAIITLRLPNPAHKIYSLNFGLFYGLRNEMELRYAADRRYVEDGIIPTEADYGNVKGAPSVELMKTAGPPEQSTPYYKQVLTFQKKHADMLLNGRFLADRDVKLEHDGRYVMANAYKSKSSEELGILVWNLSDEPVSYNVSYPGYKVKSVCAPDREVTAGDKIDPQSIHLVIFEK